MTNEYKEEEIELTDIQAHNLEKRLKSDSKLIQFRFTEGEYDNTIKIRIWMDNYSFPEEYTLEKLKKMSDKELLENTNLHIIKKKHRDGTYETKGGTYKAERVIKENRIFTPIGFTSIMASAMMGPKKTDVSYNKTIWKTHNYTNNKYFSYTGKTNNISEKIKKDLYWGVYSTTSNVSYHCFNHFFPGIIEEVPSSSTHTERENDLIENILNEAYTRLEKRLIKVLRQKINMDDLKNKQTEK